jgi:hypothetical protein
MLSVAVATLIGCNNRAPESALYGTWEEPGGQPDEVLYYRFNPNHTFDILGRGDTTPVTTGRWYGGGPNIYLRYAEEFQGNRRPVIWHIVEINATELSVRYWKDGGVITFKRVSSNSPQASNQTLQPTPSRLVSFFSDD